MKDIIKNFLIKKIMIGGMSVKAGTIATVAVVTTLAVGGTTVAVTNHIFDAKSENVIIEEIAGFAENVAGQDNIETRDNINNEESSFATYEDGNGNHVDIDNEDIHIHNLLTKVVEEPTCQSAGSAYDYCPECGYTSDTYILPVNNNHVLDEWVVVTEATEVSDGLKTRSCSACGNVIETEVIPIVPHNHNYIVSVTESASCEKDGYNVYTCSVCGSSYTETVGATGHSYDKQIVVEATCTADGSKHTECTNCRITLRTETIPALGHDYGDWIIKEEAGEDVTGSKYKECSRCKDKITEEIDPLPPHVHSYSETSRTDSTCSNVGSVTYTCGCGDSYSEEIAKKEHTPGEWTVKTPATEVAAGLEIRTCTVCGTQTDSRVIDKLPHTHNYITESKAATCTEGGYEKQTCACGSVINTVIPATGHDDGVWTTVREAELGVAGSKELRCTKCSTLLDTEEIPMLTTDGTDSVYYVEVKNGDGTYRQEMVVGHYNEEEAQEMFTLVNNYREENGMDLFTMPTTYMNSYTALRAIETSYLWDHARPSGAGCEYAENIAMGNPDGKGNTPGVQAIFDAWVASSGHKENLDAVRNKNWTCISVFYKRCPVYNASGEVSRYAYIAYWVETFK